MEPSSRERSRPAGVRHYAVAAEIVAAAHDRDESSDEISGQAHGKYVAVGLRGAQRDVDGFLARFGRSEERGEVKIAVRAGHKVDSVVFDEVFAHAFGHASDDSYYQSPRGAFASQRLEKLKSRDYFLFGVVAYGASVEKYGVGLVKRVGQGVSCGLHHGDHHFRVGHIHLASVCLDEKSPRHIGRPAPCFLIISVQIYLYIER